MKDENVLQPALVTQSALTLATEVVRMILKIDDVVLTARWLNINVCILSELIIVMNELFLCNVLSINLNFNLNLELKSKNYSKKMGNCCQ